jgi:cyclopropane-fatty-acyl-phospholipid synthase
MPVLLFLNAISRTKAGNEKFRVNDYHAVSARIAREGLTGIGDAYINHEWESDDLVSLAIPLARLLAVAANSMPGKIAAKFAPGRHGWDTNGIEEARRNAEWHYDLPPEFFELFLDETLTYSCAIFESSDSSLLDAQRQKIARILTKVSGSRGSSLLDIGCGWGSLAFAAADRGMAVTALSAAGRQVEYARRRGHNVTFKVGDYRTITGQYDSIVSIEMIEAVGSRSLNEYMQIVAAALKEQGSFVLQFLCMTETRLCLSKSDTWIRRHIFPGGQILSKARVRTAAEDSGLVVVDEFELGNHYAITLDCWLRGLRDRREDIIRMGFSEAFFRLWEYYLSVCCASFQAGDLSCAQWTLRHKNGIEQS